MTSGSSQLVTVLARQGPGDLQWEIRAGDDVDGKFLTVLWRRSGNHTARSGFSGSKLPDGKLVNYWTGKTDGTPSFVMVRTAPQVESVTAVGAKGAEYPLTMSNVIEQFDLRFGATVIPDDDEIVEIRSVPSSDMTFPPTEHRAQSLKDRRGSGWISE
jgi:hypothetical protein